MGSQSTLGKDKLVYKYYAKDMLDYLIKTNMISKGVIPQMHMVRYNTPTTGLIRKRDKTKIKAIFEDYGHIPRPSSPQKSVTPE
jgi:hypothetical protein